MATHSSIHAWEIPWTKKPGGLQSKESDTTERLTTHMSIELVMPYNHFILCHPLLLMPSILPNIKDFSNESALHIRWPKYWSFSISPSNEYSGLISFRTDWFVLLAVQGTLKSLLQHHSLKASGFWHSAFIMDQLSHTIKKKEMGKTMEKSLLERPWLCQQSDISTSNVDSSLWVIQSGISHDTLCSFHSVQSLSHVQLFVTPWTAARQASLSITNSQSLLKFMSIESVIPSSHLILCHLIPFISHLQSFPASGSFPMSQLFTSGGQSIGVSASTSVLPMNIQDWSLGLTLWISLQSKGLSRVFYTTVQKHQFFSTQFSLWSNSYIHTWSLEKP